MNFTNDPRLEQSHLTAEYTKTEKLILELNESEQDLQLELLNTLQKLETTQQKLDEALKKKTEILLNLDKVADLIHYGDIVDPVSYSDDILADFQAQLGLQITSSSLQIASVNDIPVIQDSNKRKDPFIQPISFDFPQETKKRRVSLEDKYCFNYNRGKCKNVMCCDVHLCSNCKLTHAFVNCPNSKICSMFLRGRCKALNCPDLHLCIMFHFLI